uniref:Reverse transcriptase domain-containing protein n=1 Tax=Magallana gigas TaxID=29159 RepID=A0A8W8KDP5_MAGGI
MNDLELNSPNSGVLGVRSSCPSLADDLSFISTSPVQLQRLLDVAYSYSCKWRFKFNASKSCVLTFSAKCNNQKSEFLWHHGQTELPQKESYNHLGITINSKCKLSVAISDAYKKEIDTRKLLFFGRICRLDYDALPKKIFLTRLMSFMLRMSDKQKGFIPDIITILHRYDLADYLQKWLFNGTSQQKAPGKKLSDEL